MTTTDQREYHSYVEVEIKMKKANSPRKSTLLCIYQQPEALEIGGEDVRVGVSLCCVCRVRVREKLVIVHNTIIGLPILSTPKNMK